MTRGVKHVPAFTWFSESRGHSNSLQNVSAQGQRGYFTNWLCGLDLESTRQSLVKGERLLR